VERFGRDVVISFTTVLVRERLIQELKEWARDTLFNVGRVFARFVPRKSEQREPPRLICGDATENLQTIATERRLKFGIDFAVGFSVGLFPDQRENRSYVRRIAPKRLLNCFAYTCSFSVSAAHVGATTLNLDLSKKSLARGRENFVLNNLPTLGHRFIADDVMTILPRLARKGEKFDFEKLLVDSVELTERDSHILISTNCSTLRAHALEVMARYGLKAARRAGTFHRSPPLPDFPPGTGATSIWLTLR
jgi:23S rRNA (cytosine1962-C5)-methyltransferase